MENGRQSGLVFGAVFKTVRRLLKSLVCSIRTVFRQLVRQMCTPRLRTHKSQREQPYLPDSSALQRRFRSECTMKRLTPPRELLNRMVFFSTSICTMIEVAGHGRSGSPALSAMLAFAPISAVFDHSPDLATPIY